MFTYEPEPPPEGPDPRKTITCFPNDIETPCQLLKGPAYDHEPGPVPEPGSPQEGDNRDPDEEPGSGTTGGRDGVRQGPTTASPGSKPRRRNPVQDEEDLLSALNVNPLYENEPAVHGANTMRITRMKDFVKFPIVAAFIGSPQYTNDNRNAFLYTRRPKRMTNAPLGALPQNSINPGTGDGVYMFCAPEIGLSPRKRLAHDSVTADLTLSTPTLGLHSDSILGFGFLSDDRGSVVKGWRAQLNGVQGLDWTPVDSTGATDTSSIYRILGAFRADGDIDLGGAGTTISFVGRVDTTILPFVDGNNEIGSDTFAWLNVIATTFRGKQTATPVGTFFLGGEATGGGAVGGAATVQGGKGAATGAGGQAILCGGDSGGSSGNGGQATIKGGSGVTQDGAVVIGSQDTSTVSIGVAGITTSVFGTFATFNDTDIGNDTGDTLTVTARVDSIIDPSADSTHDLGTDPAASGRAWRTMYADAFHLTAQNAYTTTNVTTNRDINANTISLRALADVVGTLLDDLIAGELILDAEA